jgi:hypothetical protein
MAEFGIGHTEQQPLSSAEIETNVRNLIGEVEDMQKKSALYRRGTRSESDEVIFHDKGTRYGVTYVDDGIKNVLLRRKRNADPDEHPELIGTIPHWDEEVKLTDDGDFYEMQYRTDFDSIQPALAKTILLNDSRAVSATKDILSELNIEGIDSDSLL